jgi:hypothetical protein
MKNYSDITIVSIHGNGGIQSAIPAIKKTNEALPGSQVLLITDIPVKSDYPQAILPTKLNYAEYSHFVIYCLHSYIKTKHCLIVQDDGWALNPQNWNDDWLKYDFIGGLTHAALCKDQYWMWYQWVGKENPLVVQNGGFSLRSKRFLEAPSKYGITMQPKDHSMLNNEDVQLCCFMRPALEKVGIRFAPDEVSKFFSFEHISDIVHKNVPLNKIFGHHSRFRQLLDDNKMLWKLTDKQTLEIQCETHVYKLFEDYGYEICKI